MNYLVVLYRHHHELPHLTYSSYSVYYPDQTPERGLDVLLPPIKVRDDRLYNGIRVESFERLKSHSVMINTGVSEAVRFPKISRKGVIIPGHGWVTTPIPTEQKEDRTQYSIALGMIARLTLLA